ncbi:MAG: sensor histidine kinase, partial [Bacteroidales bacterium]|nr:sensor histidine kinase [Bacteroidales bacterium]
NKLAAQHRFINPDSALLMAKEALRLSVEQKDDYQKAIAFKNMGLISFQKSEYSEAEDFINKSIEIIRETDKKSDLASLYNTLGYINADQGIYTTAVDYMLDALKIYEEIENLRGIAAANNNIGLVYYRLKNLEKAIIYFKKSLKIAEDSTVEYNISGPTHNLGLAYYSSGKNDSALIFFKKSLKEDEKSKNRYGMLLSLNDIAAVYSDMKSLDLATSNYIKAQKLAIELGDKSMIAASTINLGQIAFENGDLDKAHKFIVEGLSIAKEINNRNWMRIGYKSLKDLYVANKNFEKAVSYFEKYMQMKDTLLGEETKQIVAEMEAKYESEKKEKKIELLNKENQINKLEIEKKKTTIWIGLLVTILVVSVLIFLFLFYQKKQKIKQMMVLQKSQNKLLEMERKVLTTIIETEDKERKRFAEDIHDGVGPLLSSIKLYLGEIHSSKKEEQKQMLDYTLELTSEAIRNIRDISYNIMPGSLSEDGLMVSLQEFCEKIRYSKQLNIEIKNEIDNRRFKHSIELIIYRTLIELINNTIKHAKATKVNISFVEDNNFIVIKYTDNGIGFDHEKIKESDKKGIGLSNINSRIASINGECKIISEIGKGTEVIIKCDNDGMLK